MMKRKQILSLLLCFCLGTCMTACGGGRTSAESSPSADSSVSSSDVSSDSSSEASSDSSSDSSSDVSSDSSSDSGKEDSSSGEFLFEMDETPASVEVYEQTRISYKLENAPSEIIWTSGDPSVAEVKDGIVTGVKTGNTTITASVGGITHSCDVSVSAATETPVLRVNKTHIASLKSLESTQIEAYLTYKEYALDAEIELSSENEEIVGVDGMVVTGIRPGTANVTVSTLYLGQVYKTEIPVVVELNVSLLRDKSSLDLYLYPHDQTQKKQDTVSVSVYVDKQLKTDANISYASADPSVATVDENGMVTSVRIGQTVVTASAVIEGKTYTAEIPVSVNMHTIETGKKVIADFPADAATECFIDLKEFPQIDRNLIKSVEYGGEIVSKMQGDAPVVDGDKLMLSNEFVQNLVKNRRYDLNISIGEVYYRFHAVFAFRYDMHLIYGRDRLIDNDGTRGPNDGKGNVSKTNVSGIGNVWQLTGLASGDLGYNMDRSVYGFPCISRIDASVDPNDTPYTWRSVNVYFPSDFTGVFHVRQCHHQVKFDNALGNTQVFSLTWASGDTFSHESDTCFYIYDAETGALVNDGHTVKGTMKARHWYTIEFDLKHRLWFDKWYEDCYWKVYANTTYYMDAAYAYDDAYRTNVLGR